MYKYDVLFFVASGAIHTNYVVNGLLKLEKENLIRLKFKRMPYQSRNRLNIDENGVISRSFRPYSWCPELEIVENTTGKKVRIAIDLQDWDTIFSYHSVKNCDMIFKRAFTEASKRMSEYGNIPILPAGIDHSAEVDSLKYQNLLRSQIFWDRIFYGLDNPKEILRYLKGWIKKKIVRFKVPDKEIKNRKVTSLNDIPARPYVFFQVEYKYWNNAHSKRLNGGRAKIIRVLREALGERFIGGMYFKQDAPEEFLDCVTNVPHSREIYLQFVKEATIVVCTNGFGESIPWKLPEYLQMGKCIVAEPLQHVIPVTLSADEVMFFENVEQCPALCEKLLQTDQQRAKMGLRAKQYYEENVRPDRSVLRMIEISLQHV